MYGNDVSIRTTCLDQAWHQRREVTMAVDTPARPAGMTRHIVPEEVWREHDQLAEYRPEGFAAEGFIHCTNGDDLVLEVANLYYRDDRRAFLLLDVDLARVRAPVIYEDEGRHYPHIYGPLEREAVRRVRRLVRDPSGSFIGIAGPNPERTT
jgi:uncharacterized protein (DUF952 family)